MPLADNERRMFCMKNIGGSLNINYIAASPQMVRFLVCKSYGCQFGELLAKGYSVVPVAVREDTIGK